MNYFKLITITAVLIISTSVTAAEWHKISGTYAITARDMVSSVEDSHLRIQLKGKSAQDLFNAMKVNEKIDECTGGMSKSVGEMECLYFTDTKKYECHFSVDIMRQKIEYGLSC